MADFSAYDSGEDSDDEPQKGVQDEIFHNMKNRKDLLSKTLKKTFSMRYSFLEALPRMDLVNFEMLGVKPMKGQTQFFLTKFYEKQNLNKKMGLPVLKPEDRETEDAGYKFFDDRVYKMKFHFTFKKKLYIWDNESGKWSCDDLPERKLIEHPEFSDFYAWNDQTVPASDSVNTWEHDGSKWVKVYGEGVESQLSKSDYAKMFCTVFEEKVVPKQM